MDIISRNNGAILSFAMQCNTLFIFPFHCKKESWLYGSCLNVNLVVSLTGAGKEKVSGINGTMHCNTLHLKPEQEEIEGYLVRYGVIGIGVSIFI
jgi:hypothetical protein